MNIGFTGSQGFVGSYLLEYVRSKQMGRVRVLVRSRVGANEDIGIEAIYGDLRSLDDCERFTRGLELILHLAHTNAPVNSDLDQVNDVLLNIVPLLNLLRGIEASKTKPHVIYFSSGGAVYARGTERIPFRELDPCRPSSSYGIQKLAAEHYLRIAAERGHLTCTVLRIGNAYGALLPRQRMQGLIGVAISQVLQRKPVRLFGSLNNIRDYVHLDDICTVVEKVSRPKEPFTVVNVGSGIGQSVSDVLQNIQSCIDWPLEVEIVKDRQLGRWLTDWVVLNISKAKTEFGWVPEVKFQEAIGAMVTDYRAQIKSAGALT
jgi:UDP-glucose 4-epimerase